MPMRAYLRIYSKYTSAADPLKSAVFELRESLRGLAYSNIKAVKGWWRAWCPPPVYPFISFSGTTDAFE